MTNTVLYCSSGLDGEPLVEITHNVTAVLGEVVYLGCRYLGQSEILNAKWIRQINSKVKSKGLSGFLNGQPFSRNDFSEPDSVTNLTVKMTVSSVDVGGEYICEFESEEGYFSDQAFVTVVGELSRLVFLRLRLLFCVSVCVCEKELSLILQILNKTTKKEQCATHFCFCLEYKHECQWDLLQLIMV